MEDQEEFEQDIKERIERRHAELLEKAKTDPEFARKMESALYMMKKYADTYAARRFLTSLNGASEATWRCLA